MDDFNLKDKTVLVRVDFNSPLDPETKKSLMTKESVPTQTQPSKSWSKKAQKL